MQQVLVRFVNTLLKCSVLLVLVSSITPAWAAFNVDLTPDTLKQTLTYAVWGFLVLAVIMLASSLWIVLLKWQVRNQTRDLLVELDERRRLSEQLIHQESHDALTGVLNRHSFEQRLNHALKNVRKFDQKNVVCFIDLDQFEFINDSYGHGAGDDLLRRVACFLEAQIGENDCVARFAGDKFGLFLENRDTESADQFAQELLARLRKLDTQVGDRYIPLTASVGVAPMTGDIKDAQELLANVNVATFAAKEEGRNRVCHFHPHDWRTGGHRKDILRLAELHEAIDENRLVLYSQPIMALAVDNPTVHHYELLVRMRDKNNYLLLPGKFIPAAERYGMMNLIDRWVIQQAFTCYSQRHANGDGPIMGLNLSGNSLSDRELLAFIEDMLTQYRVPTDKICFEITETAAISNFGVAKNIINGLRDHGVSFALDDFGSGMSSFSYLKQLPVDYIKIDGWFVRNMLNDPVDNAIVRSVTQFGKMMNIKIIAEFVENEDLVRVLRRIGVDYAQGDEIGKPVAWHGV
ncbi:MAG: EAL domain-containing protein [Gammaproteobacteria bacterium]|nr:EAL domain-containing protein [Gammaproteobacteria bacterium]